ncbi:response regulator [Dendronalium sp. ChiSLP03b]|uniref:response regulator n=1 Tax=Dendronalium sp. ChiSLP03b TaxID=3075381 RepID=UPI002AD55F64|nr:response regulator [Dendronalium sp. ChiSLP03b]MDZ8205726.1 response regulator [Dendronalium sp. ChiSLP03b]
MKILLVEDDESLIAVLTKSLVANHYVVDTVKDGEMGWTYGSTFEYDLIVLDIMLPKLDGISLCQRFRAEGYTTPILLLTAQDTSTAKVRGLDAGADDYVVKPFDGLELIARIRALVRRSSVSPFPLMTWGDLLLNPSTCEVTYNGQLLTLTTQEYRLLELLLWDSQHVFSTSEILDRLWSSEEFPAEATVRSHIRRLRQKLVAAGAPPDFIATVHGRGYYLKAPGQETRLQPDLPLVTETQRAAYPLISRRGDAERSCVRGFPPLSKLRGTRGHDEEVGVLDTTSLKSAELKGGVAQVCVESVSASGSYVRAVSPSGEGASLALTVNLVPFEHGAMSDRDSDQQAQYQTFLNETWVTNKPKILEQLTIPSQAARELQAGSINCQLQEQAQQIAHKLAGTLGTFGLTSGMQLARQLEQLLDSHKPLQPQSAVLMETLINGLQQEIQNTTTLQHQSPSKHSPLLLVVDRDSHFTQSLVKVAASCGIRSAIAPTIEVARDWLASKSISDVGSQFPQAILLQLPSVQSRSKTETTDFREWVQTLTQHHPDLPILVVGAEGELTDRLEVVRRGGKLFLEPSVDPKQAIAAVIQLLSGSDMGVKVMIVDDDRDWLRTLPTLLNPWGFKVTTLAEPQQFWTVLQVVMPDVLVLDVNMPQINGFELCQVVRSDPRWQQLPVLFLSVLTDAKTQNQAFTLGADDYLCKPIMGVDLANRILNRLQRVRAWASPQYVN